MMMELSKEFQAKAQWCADLMRADGITQEHVSNMSEEQKADLMMSYMAAIGRKIEMIQSIYLTRAEAKKAMNDLVLAAI